MKKDLKEVIRDNRASFDDATPPERVWDAIGAALDRQEKDRRRSGTVKLLYSLLKVAAVLLLVSMGVALWISTRSNRDTNYSRINPDLAEKQELYSSQIELKKDSLEFLSASNPKMYQQFSNVLEQMQKNYRSLQYELTQSPNKQLTLQAMIRNLQAQMEVLSQQLQVLQQVETKSDETNKKI